MQRAGNGRALASGGERVPLVGRAARRGDVGEADRRQVVAEVALDVPREADAVGLDAVADEGGHGDTAVLDLGVAEETNGLGLHVLVDNVERIPEACRCGRSAVRLLAESPVLRAGAYRRPG